MLTFSILGIKHFNAISVLAWDAIDSFEDSALPGWQILAGSSGIRVCNDQVYDGNFSLCLKKPADGYIEMKKNVSSVTNKKFSMRYYDNLEKKGTQWRVENSSTGQYYMVGIKDSTNPDNYFVRYSDDGGNLLYFDTGVKRTLGWHQFEIIVTEIGTYAKIDGFNTSYLGMNNGDRPLNNTLTSIDAIYIASTWSVISDDYYDLLESEAIEKFDGVTKATLKRLENFVQKYTDRFIGAESYSIEDIAQDGDNQLSRSAANLSLALSILCLESGNENHCQNSLVLADKVRQSYYVALNNWKAVDSSNPYFIYNSSPLTLYPLLLTTWINKDRLTIEEYDSYYEIFSQEANWFLDHDLAVELISEPGNSNSETLAWTGAYLCLAGKAFENPSWLDMGNYLIESSLLEENIGVDYRFYNHNIFHPAYAFYTLASVAEAGLSYRVRGEEIPIVWKDNIVNLYKGSIESNVAWNYRYFYLNFTHGVDDWHRTPVDSAISALTLLEYFEEGINDNLGKYIWYVAHDYQTFPEIKDLAADYEVDNYEVGVDTYGNVKYVYSFLDEYNKRLLVNGCVAFYDAITYFYETNFLLDSFLSPPTTFICLFCPVGQLLKSLGNADCNSKINALDFTGWLKVYRQVVDGELILEEEKGPVDFNCQADTKELIVDFEDFAIWAKNYGSE
ncbi:hypothetical protein KKD62_03195 [Patescibacteria group bacterium]|nr:hypothetical protein [Patescibacteria group bacterium]MBU1931531.1 hypothetical protein [Patescibacteria group bacterium]